MPPESDPRVLYSYKCHACKKVKEPREYRESSNTGYKKVVCDSCADKLQERRDSHAHKKREEREEREEQERLQR